MRTIHERAPWYPNYSTRLTWQHNRCNHCIKYIITLYQFTNVSEGLMHIINQKVAMVIWYTIYLKLVSHEEIKIINWNYILWTFSLKECCTYLCNTFMFYFMFNKCIFTNYHIFYFRLNVIWLWWHLNHIFPRKGCPFVNTKSSRHPDSFVVHVMKKYQDILYSHFCFITQCL